MTTSATCPTCGRTVVAPVFLEAVRASRVEMDCPRCGVFNATPGGEGTFSTIDGRLQVVARHLAEQPTDELNALRSRIAELERDRDERRAMETLVALGVQPPSGGWFGSQANRNELWQVLALISTLILGILALR